MKETVIALLNNVDTTLLQAAGWVTAGALATYVLFTRRKKTGETQMKQEEIDAMISDRVLDVLDGLFLDGKIDRRRRFHNMKRFSALLDMSKQLLNRQEQEKMLKTRIFRRLSKKPMIYNVTRPVSGKPDLKVVSDNTESPFFNGVKVA